MVCHRKDFVSVALGEREAEFQGSWFTRLPPVCKVVFYGLPRAKAQRQIPKEVDPKRAESRPGVFTGDKAELRRLLDRSVETPEEEVASRPIAGQISKRDWGRAIWKNFDHHLQDFGL